MIFRGIAPERGLLTSAERATAILGLPSHLAPLTWTWHELQMMRSPSK